jgi:hypothetical protein
MAAAAGFGDRLGEIWEIIWPTPELARISGLSLARAPLLPWK